MLSVINGLKLHAESAGRYLGYDFRVNKSIKRVRSLHAIELWPSPSHSLISHPRRETWWWLFFRINILGHSSD